VTPLPSAMAQVSAPSLLASFSSQRGSLASRTIEQYAGSFAGAYVGGMVGAAAGAAIPGPDLTGIPEVVGAVVGAGVGGFAGGTLGNDLANRWLGP
jgi:hypothetical protein